MTSKRFVNSYTEWFKAISSRTTPDENVDHEVPDRKVDHSGSQLVIYDYVRGGGNNYSFRRAPISFETYLSEKYTPDMMRTINFTLEDIPVVDEKDGIILAGFAYAQDMKVIDSMNNEFTVLFPFEDDNKTNQHTDCKLHYDDNTSSIAYFIGRNSSGNKKIISYGVQHHMISSNNILRVEPYDVQTYNYPTKVFTRRFINYVMRVYPTFDKLCVRIYRDYNVNHVIFEPMMINMFQIYKSAGRVVSHGNYSPDNYLGDVVLDPVFSNLYTQGVL